MGRPKLELNEETIRELASIQCTMKEIASVMDCSVDTLENRFSDIIKKGQEEGKSCKSSLRRRQDIHRFTKIKRGHGEGVFTTTLKTWRTG